MTDLMTTDPITIYTTTWCSDCRMVKRYFKEHSIPFVEVNIEDDEAAMEQVIAWNNGHRSVPTFHYNGRLYSEPNRSQLDQLRREMQSSAG